ncbi:hypothetical protein SAMN04489707_11082, partial [Paenacidovorax caeni]
LADTGQLSSYGPYFTNNKGPEGPLLNLGILCTNPR